MNTGITHDNGAVWAQTLAAHGMDRPEEISSTGLSGDGRGGEIIQALHRDHLGSVRQVTDWNGHQSSRHRYYPFGEEATPVSDTDPAHKFTGHERDEGFVSDLPLDYMHARYCSPILGRFFSIDPKRKSGRLRLPQSWNRFSYVHNNPIKFKDPNGEDLRIAYDFSKSNLTVREQGQVARGIRQRFINAGVRNVQNYFPTKTIKGTVGGPPKPRRPSDQNVTLVFVGGKLKGRATVLGMNKPPSTKAYVSTAFAPEGNLNQIINTGAHEAGHATRALRLYDADNRPPGSILHPDPADSGSIMEQGVSVEDLSKGLREFSDEDVASLATALNDDDEQEIEE